MAKLITLLILPQYILAYIVIATLALLLSPYIGIQQWRNRYAWDWGFEREE